MGQPARIPNEWDSSSLGLNGQTVFVIGSEESYGLFERATRAVIRVNAIDRNRQLISVDGFRVQHCT